MKAEKFTSLNFFSDLRSPYARRRFLFALIVLCILGLLGAFLGPHLLGNFFWGNLVASASIEIFSGILIILLVYGAYVFFIGPNEQEVLVDVLRPRDIGDHIARLPVGTSEYIFWGRSGSFFRAHTLREIISSSKEKRRHVSIVVILPDPRNNEFLELYSDFQVRLGDRPDTDILFKSVVATAVACAIAQANNPDLRIEFYLSKFLPVFRLDLANSAAILTQDDKKLSALKFDSDSEFFQMFKSMGLNEAKLSDKLEIDIVEARGVSLDQNDVPVEAIQALGFDPKMTGDLLDEIWELVRGKTHRYQ